MSQRHDPRLTLRALMGPIERLAQANIALVLAQAVIVRLSVLLSTSTDSDPDPLLLLGFLAACGVAVAIVVALARVIRRFPRRSLRIAIALGTVLLQSAAFQALHALAS